MYIPMNVVRLFAVALAFLPRAGRADESTIKFNRDIRPILAENCFTCHGPDKNKREADLRLDTQAGALAATRRTITQSCLANLRRANCSRASRADDEAMRMPPMTTDKKLSARQVELLRAWIAAGAAWQEHWSYTPIERPRLSTSAQAAHPIDAFLRRASGRGGSRAGGRGRSRDARPPPVVRSGRAASRAGAGRIVCQ